jgi:GH15 family glucan-1,4-alpha-glucosidase
LSAGDAYPPIAGYGMIGDCHSAALVSREGSIDWWCPARFDAGACFARLLDRDRGGHFSLAPRDGGYGTFQAYFEETMVLCTTFRVEGGEARVIDFCTVRRGGATDPVRQLVRIAEGARGHVELSALIAPRFDYGEVHPATRQLGPNVYGLLGGDDGLVVSSDAELVATDGHELEATFTVRAGERVRLSMLYRRPEQIDADPPRPLDPGEVDERLEETLAWWRRWASRSRFEGPESPGVRRSALVLKALTNAPTGAMVAAPTTSLPEVPGGSANWDYRYAWIRDSTFSARALTALGHESEADAFRRFVERSAAGSSDQLLVFYGIGGERRPTELELDLEGYRGRDRCGSATVRPPSSSSMPSASSSI